MLKRFRVRNHWLAWAAGLVAVALLSSSAPRLHAQDADDPPGRVARLAYLEGSVSFQPAGESEWVQAVPNRPMTTGDKLWADRDSRAEVQLGSATLELAPNTGFSFLNLDDRTIQIQLSAGSLNVRVWDLDRDDVFEIDTPNQAFTAFQAGRYRVDASENGDYTVVSVRQGEGESTGNGQSYTMHSGQRFTLRGTTSLNAEVDQFGGPDDFDNWSYQRQDRYENSPSGRYCSRRVVGFEDLDDYGDWRPDPQYGNVWFPRVDAGWAPYHDGHWAWIDPWGWTWVDDDRWGYAPFHYGRWASFGGRWGWIPGPREERPVYAPALVAFVGGGAIGATVAWFPLGPREVYVPSYRVSPAYVNRVNITNTTVNQTTITNVYNTTIVQNNTAISNVTYVNRNVRGGVTAVPQQAFSTAQPVARTAVAVNPQQFAKEPVVARAAVPPAPQAVLGARASTANRVAAPPQAVASRPVIAKATPPPAPPPFAARQQALKQHPGMAVPRQELAKMRPASGPAAPVVKQAPPAKPATPTPAMNRPGAQPNPAGNSRPENQPPANTPGNNRPHPTPPARSEQPPAAAPNNRPQPNTSNPANRPEPAPTGGNRPGQPAAQPPTPAPAQPKNRPEANPPTPNQPSPNRPEPTPGRAEPPSRADRPNASEPNDRRQPRQPAPDNRAEPNRPTPPEERTNRPTSPPPNRQEAAPSANNRPESPRAEPNRPAPPAQRADRPPSAQQRRPEPKQAPDKKQQQQEQKKQREEQKKQNNKPD